MFDLLSEKLLNTFASLRGRGNLSEQDVDAALRDIRRALLEADVALPVVKHLVAQVRADLVGTDKLKSIKPGEQVVKAVYDNLLATLGEPQQLQLPKRRPAVVLLCGLQGSGKTTSAAKLAKYLQEKMQQSVLLASLDVYRPAAQLQLQQLSTRVNAPMLDIRTGEQPLAITKRALAQARDTGVDVLILDTAGRLEIDAQLMTELQQVRDLAQPDAVLLVVDALTGQVAVQVAEQFQQQIGVTGLIFTRIDGDGRGGAVLSVRHVTGVPIHFLGTGETVQALEPFRPDGLVGRILGQGDVVALVEKVQAATAGEDPTALQDKLLSGKGLDLEDLMQQLRMMLRLGGLGGLMNFLPGMGKLKSAAAGSVDDRKIKHQIAIIQSMTPQERKNPGILNARRRLRIAKGCGLQVADVNKLLKMHMQMNKMMKMIGKNPQAMLSAMKGLGGKSPW